MYLYHIIKVKLLGVLDGRSSQLHALATLFAHQMASVSYGLEAGVDVGHLYLSVHKLLHAEVS
jgi:hypothetical protein